MKLNQELLFAQQIVEYLKAGGAIKQVEGHAPRKSERTFPPIRGSLSNQGHMTVALKERGLRGKRI